MGLDNHKVAKTRRCFSFCLPDIFGLPPARRDRYRHGNGVTLGTRSTGRSCLDQPNPLSCPLTVRF